MEHMKNSAQLKTLFIGGQMDEQDFSVAIPALQLPREVMSRPRDQKIWINIYAAVIQSPCDLFNVKGAGSHGANLISWANQAVSQMYSIPTVCSHTQLCLRQQLWSN